MTSGEGEINNALIIPKRQEQLANSYRQIFVGKKWHFLYRDQQEESIATAI